MTFAEFGVSDAWPALSADGRWIAFQRYAERPGIYLVPVGGGEARRPVPGTEGSAPRWRP